MALEESIAMLKADIVSLKKDMESTNEWIGEVSDKLDALYERVTGVNL